MEADIGCLSTCRWLLVVATFGIPSKLNIDYIKQVTRGCKIRSEKFMALIEPSNAIFCGVYVKIVSVYCCLHTYKYKIYAESDNNSFNQLGIGTFCLC